MFELYEVITNNHIFRLGMYAVLKTGGKQYKVQKDSKLLVEKIEANVGDEVLFNEVLMIGDGEKINFGSPKIEDAAVLAEVIKQTRGPKITIIYKRRRKNSRRKQGHKQDLTLLKVKDIATSGGSSIQPKKSTVKKPVKKEEVKKVTKVEKKQTLKDAKEKAPQKTKKNEEKLVKKEVSKRNRNLHHVNNEGNLSRLLPFHHLHDKAHVRGYGRFSFFAFFPSRANTLHLLPQCVLLDFVAARNCKHNNSLRNS